MSYPEPLYPDAPVVLFDFDSVLNYVLPQPLDDDMENPAQHHTFIRTSGWDASRWKSSFYDDQFSGKRYVITTNSEMLDAVIAVDDTQAPVCWLTTWTMMGGKLTDPHPMSHSLCEINSPAVLSPGVIHENADRFISNNYRFLTELMGRELPAAYSDGDNTAPLFESPDVWWKYRAFQEIRKNHPVAFIDDHLFYGRERFDVDDPYSLLLGVRPDAGYTRKDHETLLSFLTAHRS